MLGRPRRYFGRVLGAIFYWIGWGIAAIVLVQAIILSVTTGSPLVPVMLGVTGVVIWLVGVAIKYVLGGRHVPP